MTRVIVDSDDEDASLEDEVPSEAASHTDRLGEADESEQGIGSTDTQDKLLRAAHQAITEPTPQPTHKRKLDLNDQPGQTPTKVKKQKLKSSRSKSDGIIDDLENNARKGSQAQIRRDDWDVPSSSSPVRSSAHGRITPSLPAPGAAAGESESQAQPPRKLYPVPVPESTIMNSTSSWERRAHEAHELGQAGTSSLSTDPSFVRQQPTQTLSQTRERSVTGSQTIHATGTPHLASDAVIILNHDSVSKSARKRSKAAKSPTPVAPPTQKRPKRSMCVQEDPADNAPDELNLSDELAAQGLPKERYVPRPSRSRSMGNAQGPSTQDPEPTQSKPTKTKAKARGSKRLKSEGDTIDASPILGSQKVNALTELGFSPTRVKEALQEADGSKDAAANLLLNDVPDIQKPIKKSKRSKPAQPEDEDEVEIEAKHKSIFGGFSEEPEAPTPLPADRKSKRVIKEDDEEDDVTLGESVHAGKAEPEILIEAPRKRGRPRKEDASAPTANLDKEPKEDEADELAHIVIPEAKRAEPPIVVDIHPDPPAPESDNSAPIQKATTAKKLNGRGRPKKSAVKVATPTPSPEPQAKVGAEVETLVKSETVQEEDKAAAKKRSEEAQDEKENLAPLPAVKDDSSPIKPNSLPRSATPSAGEGKGRVPLRVGLSKRTRIPSLLRSAKKS